MNKIILCLLVITQIALAEKKPDKKTPGETWTLLHRTPSFVEYSVEPFDKDLIVPRSMVQQIKKLKPMELTAHKIESEVTIETYRVDKFSLAKEIKEKPAHDGFGPKWEASYPSGSEYPKYIDVRKVLKANRQLYRITLEIESIKTAALLVGETKPQVHMHYDGNEVLVNQIDKIETPITTQITLESTHQNEWIAKLSFTREDRTFPNNDLEVTLKQGDSSSTLVLHVRNINCDPRDDSTFIIEGEVQRSRWLSAWWWTGVDYFHAELLERACQDNEIVLKDLPLKDGRKVAVQYRLVKTKSRLFAEVPSKPKWSAILSTPNR